MTDDSSNKASSALDRGAIWHRMLALTKPPFGDIENVVGHKIITIEPIDIIDVAKIQMKIDAENIVNNWTQRQMPRFRDAPISQATNNAIAELMDYTKSMRAARPKVQFFNFGKEFKLLQDLELIKLHRQKMDEWLPHTRIANFEQEFGPVFERKQLETKQSDLRFKMSDQNLSLYPEYQYKLEILKRLNYIDDQHAVTLKGRVACEMGSNELMITELVLCNTFNDLSSAEIAATLSSLVFQGKVPTEPQLTDNLKAVSTSAATAKRPVLQQSREQFVFFLPFAFRTVHRDDQKCGP